MTEGTVSKITERRYGFIRDEHGLDYFFHADDVVPAGEFDILRRGMRVTFLGVDDPKGPRAAKVTVIR